MDKLMNEISLLKTKEECYQNYLTFCQESQVIPNKSIISMIGAINNQEAANESLKKIKQGLEFFRTANK